MTQVNLFFHGLWVLCGAGAVVFAASPTPRRRMWLGPACLGLGFAVGMGTIRPDRLPDPVWVGGAAAFVAGLVLFKPRAGTCVLASACGGVLAALWGVLLRVQGTPTAIALALAAAVPAASAILAARRPRFAPDRLREEALLVVLALGVIVSMAPGAAAGWQSAVALNAETLAETLNVQHKDAASQMMPIWLLATTAAATLLGGVHALWMRR